MSRGIWSHQKSALNTPLFDRFGWIVILCMQGTLLAQLLIPGSIFYSAFYDNLDAHGEWLERDPEKAGPWFCPNQKTNSVQERIIMLMISLIYVARLTLLAIKKGNDLLGSAKGKRQSKLKTHTDRTLHLHRDLSIYMLFDQLMDIVYEPAVYCINLFLVFITGLVPRQNPENLASLSSHENLRFSQFHADTAIDMVLNALAMEFVLKLDEDLKGCKCSEGPGGIHLSQRSHLVLISRTLVVPCRSFRTSRGGRGGGGLLLAVFPEQRRAHAARGEYSQCATGPVLQNCDCRLACNHSGIFCVFCVLRPDMQTRATGHNAVKNL
jgi:hypothetical protein